MDGYTIYNLDGTELETGTSGSKDKMINANYLYPAAITDEFYTSVGDGIFRLGTIRRAFKGLSIVIRTAVEGGGTLLVENTDYTIEDEDSYYLEKTGFHTYFGLKIINADYQACDLYITYSAYGTYNDVTTDILANMPIGVVITWPSKATLPSKFKEQNGDAISRATYSTALGVLTITQTGTLTDTSAVVTGLSDTTKLDAGSDIEGVGVPAGTTISKIDSGTQITMSQAATASGENSLQFFPYGNGDASTTFNLPDTEATGAFIRHFKSGTSAAIGTKQDHAMQAHVHVLLYGDGEWPDYFAGSTNAYGTGAGAVNSDYKTGTLVTDGTHGAVDATSSETRPVNYAMIYIIKVL